MVTYFYVFANDLPTGPYTIGQLRSMWATGSVNARTHFCRAGEEHWSRLETMIAELDDVYWPMPGAQSRNLDVRIADDEERFAKREKMQKHRNLERGTTSSDSSTGRVVSWIIGGVILLIVIGAISGGGSGSNNSSMRYEKNTIPNIQTHSDYLNASESEQRAWADKQAKQFQGSGPYPVTGKDLQEGLDAFYSK